MDQDQAKEYEKKLKNSKFPEKETLRNLEHNLLVKGYKLSEMKGIYDDLGDLEMADLCDFFNLERSDGERV